MLTKPKDGTLLKNIKDYFFPCSIWGISIVWTPLQHVNFGNSESHASVELVNMLLLKPSQTHKFRYQYSETIYLVVELFETASFCSLRVSSGAEHASVGKDLGTAMAWRAGLVDLIWGLGMQMMKGFRACNCREAGDDIKPIGVLISTLFIFISLYNYSTYCDLWMFILNSFLLTQRMPLQDCPFLSCNGLWRLQDDDQHPFVDQGPRSIPALMNGRLMNMFFCV